MKIVDTMNKQLGYMKKKKSIFFALQRIVFTYASSTHAQIFDQNSSSYEY